MKAYRDADGGVRLFRPDLNMRRFNRSMGRLCFPEVDEASMVELIRYFMGGLEEFRRRQERGGGGGVYVYNRETDIICVGFVEEMFGCVRKMWGKHFSVWGHGVGRSVSIGAVHHRGVLLGCSGG